MIPQRNLSNSSSTDSKKMFDRAKNYPYRIPQHSYMFYQGSDYPLQLSEQHSFANSKIYWNNQWISMSEFCATFDMDILEDLSDRIPVLASGSNASPQQLARKFARFKKAMIPVVKAKLYDFDVVYSAHFSSYSAIPATFYYSPGTILNTFITYLTRSQLEQMHKTEGIGFTYCFVRFDQIKLILENQITLNQVQSYLSLHGCLALNNSVVSLDAIAAENRQFPQMTELEILTSVTQNLEPDISLDHFILETVSDRKLRKQRIKRLKETARPFNYPHYQILLS
jgi:hypothetical protein